MLDRWDPLILLHAISATYALTLGAFQLVGRRRGDRPHRIIGWSWAAAMALVIATSFWIRTITGGFSWLHALSLFTAATVTLGVIAARLHNIQAHKAFMTGSYIGLLGALVGVLTVPERRIPDTAAHHPLLVALFVAVVMGSVAAGVWGVVKLAGRPKVARTHNGRTEEEQWR